MMSDDSSADKIPEDSLNNSSSNNDTTNNPTNLSDNTTENTSNKTVDDADNNDYEGSIFYLKRPKDVTEGFGQGVGNILKGALGGAALLVTAPIKGAYDGGYAEGSLGALKGFGAGLGIGVIGGLSMIIGGTVTGCFQIGRGIANTPSSLTARSEGKDWDSETREWILYNLIEESELYLHMSEEDYLKSLQHIDPVSNNTTTTTTNADGTTTEEQAEAPRPIKKVHDLEYYEVLGIPSNANTAEIKKAYYKKARDNHPDRHPDDPEAHAKFQVIGQAYQVLSDENLRSNYDSHGKDSVENSSKIDPSTLFAMIFGSEKFVPLVGELKVAAQMQAGEDDHSNPKLKKFRQRKREITCALNLVSKLQVYIDLNGNEEAYKVSLVEELDELSCSPFGSTLVATIGKAYQEAACTELSTMDGIAVGFTQTGRSINTSISIATAGIKAAFVAKEVQEAQKIKQQQVENSKNSANYSDTNPNPSSTSSENNSGDTPAGTANTTVEDESMKEKYERLSGHMFTVMWYVTEIDIRSTLASVCTKVLHDHSVSDTIRTLRAKGMKVLGDYFISRGGTLAAGLGDMKAKLHTQMNNNTTKPEKTETSQSTDTFNDTTNSNVNNNNNSSSNADNATIHKENPIHAAAAAVHTNNISNVDIDE